MIPPRTVRRVIIWWQNRSSRKAIRRAIPEMADLDARHRKCVKAHRKGSAALYAAKREVMTEELRREVVR